MMKESEIRPQDIFNEYLHLSAQDASQYFNSTRRMAIACPGCDKNESMPAFIKSGFQYVQCNYCQSLYLSPRPPMDEFAKFYQESLSSQFWATKFFPSVAESRRERIFVPRVNQISHLCRANHVEPQVVMDVGAGYGIFLEEWKKQYPDAMLRAIEPSPELAAVCRAKGITVLQTFAEQSKSWHNQANLLTCFEVIEHAHQPLEFVKSLFDLVKPGGFALITGLGVEGFDIQLLWEKSKSVSPPHHINFFSVKGFQLLFERAGFSQVQVFTPGQLDVDIVASALQADEDLTVPRFVRLLLSRGDKACEAFQTFLANYQLSSHCWIFAKKTF